MKRATPKKTTLAAGFTLKRTSLTARIADALLKAGVAEIPLRELAARIGTSDRMLLYYFSDKTDLVQSSLQEISLRLATLLGGSLSTKSSPDTLLANAIPLLRSRAITPFMRVWADLSARGSRGEEPFLSLARTSVRGWLAWVEQRLDMQGAPARRQAAAAVLIVLEGARLLEEFVPGTTHTAVTLLSRRLAFKRG